MFIQLNDLDQFVSYFDKVVRESNKLLAKFDKAREENSLAVFLRSYSVDLQVAVVQAALAKDFLKHIEDSLERKIEKASLYVDLIDVIERHVRNMTLNLNSSSCSVNIDQDAQNKFYLEIFRNLK